MSSMWLYISKKKDLKIHSDTNHNGVKQVCDFCVFQENTKAILKDHVETNTRDYHTTVENVTLKPLGNLRWKSVSFKYIQE